MPKYSITVPITGYEILTVEAMNAKEAAQKILDGHPDVEVEHDDLDWSLDSFEGRDQLNYILKNLEEDQ